MGLKIPRTSVHEGSIPSGEPNPHGEACVSAYEILPTPFRTLISLRLTCRCFTVVICVICSQITGTKKERLEPSGGPRPCRCAPASCSGASGSRQKRIAVPGDCMIEVPGAARCGRRMATGPNRQSGDWPVRDDGTRPGDPGRIHLPATPDAQQEDDSKSRRMRWAV